MVAKRPRDAAALKTEIAALRSDIAALRVQTQSASEIGTGVFAQRVSQAIANRLAMDGPFGSE